MAICKNFLLVAIINCFLIFFSNNPIFAEQSFKKLENKKVSFVDFFLMKYENKLVRRSQALRSEVFPTRVQYSNVSIEVDFDNNKKEILTDIYAVMSKSRYLKKKYNQKLSDCNQVRNILFYRKHGYKFFSQKRDPNFSQEKMKDIFLKVFFNNVNLDEEEKDFLLEKMFVKVTIFHPVNKTELSCFGKANDYELR